MPQDPSILEQFDKESETLEALAQLLGRLLPELLNNEPFRIHSINARLKERQSLEHKIAQNPGKYSQLSDITDVCGVRVITYFEDHVDAVAQIIEREFEIDRPNSIDKRIASEPDRFGYTVLRVSVSSDSR